MDALTLCGVVLFRSVGAPSHHISWQKSKLHWIGCIGILTDKALATTLNTVRSQGQKPKASNGSSGRDMECVAEDSGSVPQQ